MTVFTENPYRDREKRANLRLLSLPMYDLPELAWAHDAFSQGLLAALAASPGVPAGSLPERRTQPADLLAAWRDPSLLLSQSCGYPMVTTLQGQARIVATPCYKAEGCDGAWMRSALVVRTDEPARSLAELRGRATCAINGWDSNSGMNLLRAAVAPLAEGRAFFRDVLVTGAHVASLKSVAGGAADIAAIDCVTWALLSRARPAATAGLRVLEWSLPTPGLPLITSVAMPEAGVSALRAALDTVLADMALQPALQALLIEGFEWLDEAVYQRVAGIEQEAVALSYPVLR